MGFSLLCGAGGLVQTHHYHLRKDFSFHHCCYITVKTQTNTAVTDLKPKLGILHLFFKRWYHSTRHITYIYIILVRILKVPVTYKFLLFCGSFFTTWIRIRQTKFHTDPEFGSTTMQKTNTSGSWTKS
jgi:hypothetical protein